MKAAKTRLQLDDGRRMRSTSSHFSFPFQSSQNLAFRYHPSIENQPPHRFWGWMRTIRPIQMGKWCMVKAVTRSINLILHSNLYCTDFFIPKTDTDTVHNADIMLEYRIARKEIVHYKEIEPSFLE